MGNTVPSQYSPEGLRPSGEYFWSEYRSKMWKRCRREYFLHYYASQSGKLSYATENERELLRRRSLVSASGYFLRTVHSAANATFNAERPFADTKNGHVNFAEQYSRILWRIFRQDRKAILLETNWNDPELPFPIALYFDHSHSPEEFFQELTDAVTRATRDFFQSPWRELLAELTAFDIVPTRVIESFPVAECTVFLKIPCAFRLSGKVYTVSFCNASRPASELAITAALHKLWAFHHWKNSPERTTTLFFTPGANDRNFRYVPDDVLQISMVLDKIKSEVGFFANITPATSPDSLPRSPESCETCRFRGLCSDLF